MNATEKFSKDWWTWRYNECQEEELNTAFHQIGNIVGLTGQWNTEAKVLEVQAGLGVMPHYMNDHGFCNFYGTDGDKNLNTFWETSNMMVAEPDSLPFSDEEFDLVTWFTMSDGRVPKEDWEDVIAEMGRVTKGHIIVRPYDEYTAVKDEDFLGWMLEKHWRCTNLTPVLWYYTFIKE